MNHRLDWLPKVQPFLRYQGGKSKLAKKIVAELPPHKIYVEPMVGGGSVYFAKPSAEREIISDSDGNLMTFYKALKKGKISRCNSTPNKKKLLKIRDKRRANKSLSPCEYLYLNKISFGGKGTSFDPNSLKKCIGKMAKTCGYSSKDQTKYADRLKKTRIERGDFRNSIKKYDSKDTVFYLDPPYAGTSTEGYTERDLQPEEVKKAVDKIKGKFILSYNDTKQNRKLFCSRNKRRYVCKKVETIYTLNNRGVHLPKKELLIKNYVCKITKSGKICEKI